MQNYQNYLSAVYSGWLGKIIGIRLGAPVENFSYEKVRELYGEKKDYPIDYGIFAADDDSNGPLFFVRALLDYGKLTYESIGNTFLNYLQEYKGFFWWGGDGISSEHTAYENIKNGIMPPFSGSYKVNGKTIAEQIGGQIFSDCWGYVSLGKPERAKELAKIASSATHDLSGIEGGIFVAVCISLAYKYKDIYTVIEKAMTYLNPELEYYKVLKDIRDFYDKDKDFEHCFKYIRDNYGYDRYPGVCHIIPNSCVMLAGMLYGDGDFEKTLLLINNCGWDTDCNCGNVGSIMGVLVGIDGISEKWVKPNNDIVNASSCIGSLNIQNISSSAKMFAKLAYKLDGIDIEDDKMFDLPYATSGFFGDLKVEDGCLKGNGEIYKYTYYLGSDIYDSRYDPSFSPVLSAGDEVKVEADKDLTIYVEDMDGNRFTGVNSLSIPSNKNLIVHKLGFIGENYKITDIRIKRSPKLDYDFKDWSYDVYGPRYAGDNLTNIRAFVLHHGNAFLEDGLKLKGFITTGNLDDEYNGIKVAYREEYSSGFELLFNVKGYREYCSVYKKGQTLEIRHLDKVLKTFKCKESMENVIELYKDRIIVNDEMFEWKTDKLEHLIGFNTDKNVTVLIKWLKTL